MIPITTMASMEGIRNMYMEDLQIRSQIWRTTTAPETEHCPEPTTRVVVPIKKVALVQASKLHVDCQTEAGKKTHQIVVFPETQKGDMWAF